MLADASISRADVSKEKPQRDPVGHRTHARRPAAAEGGRQEEASTVATRHTGCRSSAAEEEGRGPTPWRRAGLDRARRRRETALRACRGGAARLGGVKRRIGEERSGVSEKRGASGTGAVRRGGGAIWGKTAKCRSGR
jgi:hypothetical protein